MSKESENPGAYGRMSPPERRGILLQLARSNGRVTVTEGARQFSVTTETVRKDLDALQEEGVIRRVHGAGVPVENLGYEPHIQKRTRWAEEKRRIARAALAELPPTGVVFIEVGTTTAQLAEELPMQRELTVVTNSLPIAMALITHPRVTVITIGGRVRPVTLGSVDGMAVRNLQDINVDVAFLGANGIHMQRGLTTPDIAEAEMKRAALHCSTKRVLLADHSKIDCISLYRYGDVSDVDVLITDTHLQPDLRADLGSAVQRLVVV